MPVSKDAGRIRRMFAEISPRYDLLNHVLSLNVDASWRRAAVRALCLAPDARVLDICTGTADLALELSSALRRACAEPASPRPALRRPLVLGTDFTPEMLRIGEGKRRRRGEDRLRLVIADSLDLPFADGTFDAVTVAFGIRNVCDLGKGIEEIRRVLRPGGRTAILEFAARRGGLLDGAFRFYFRSLLPRLGGWISGTPRGREAYSYLPASVFEFPSPPELARGLESRGFVNVRYRRLTCGIASLHIAERPVPSREPGAAALPALQASDGR